MELLLTLFGCIALIVMVELIKKRIPVKDDGVVVEKNCPPHRWEYNSNNKMFCVLCKQHPGFHVSENGNYGGK